MKMGKRGQITAFIIVGIIILAIIAFVLYLRQETEVVERPQAPGEIGPVQTFVENCLQRTGEEGIIRNSLQGGYYNNFEQDTVPMPLGNSVPIYFDGFTVQMPSEEKIRQELESYVNDNLNNCINDFESLQGYDIEEEGNVSIPNMIIGNEGITLQYNYPLSVNQETRLEGFTVNHNLRLGLVLREVRNLVAQSETVPELICFSCYVDAGLENELTFDTVNLDEFNIMVVKDRATRIPLNFAYAIKLADLQV